MQVHPPHTRICLFADAAGRVLWGGLIAAPPPWSGAWIKFYARFCKMQDTHRPLGRGLKKSQVAEKQAEIRHFFANSVFSSMLANHCSIRILNCKSSEEDKQNALDDQKRYFWPFLFLPFLRHFFEAHKSNLWGWYGARKWVIFGDFGPFFGSIRGHFGVTYGSFWHSFPKMVQKWPCIAWMVLKIAQKRVKKDSKGAKNGWNVI